MGRAQRVKSEGRVDVAGDLMNGTEPIQILALVILAVGLAMGFGATRKLYGGAWTSALPYGFIGIALIMLMFVIGMLSDAVYLSPGNYELVHMVVMQVIQLMAGMFFFKGVYEVYMARFATEGFMRRVK